MTSIAFSFLLLCIRFLFFLLNFTCVLLRKVENKGSNSILCSLKEPRILSMHRKCNLFFPEKIVQYKIILANPTFLRIHIYLFFFMTNNKQFIGNLFYLCNEKINLKTRFWYNNVIFALFFKFLWFRMKRNSYELIQSKICDIE